MIFYGIKKKPKDWERKKFQEFLFFYFFSPSSDARGVSVWCNESAVYHLLSPTAKQKQESRRKIRLEGNVRVQRENFLFSHFISLPPAIDDVFRCLLMLCINCLASSLGLCRGVRAGVRQGWMKKSLEISHFKWKTHTREHFFEATFRDWDFTHRIDRKVLGIEGGFEVNWGDFNNERCIWKVVTF